MTDFEAPSTALRSAIIDGLLVRTQVVPMDRTTAEHVANRIMQSVDSRDLTVLDRRNAAAWLGAVEEQVRPLLALHGRGQGVCDERGVHSMTFIDLTGLWRWNVIACEDCEAATQVEREE